MDDRIDRMRSKYMSQTIGVAHVDFVERYPSVGNALDPPDRFERTVGKIIDTDYVIAGRKKLDTSVGTDETGRAGYEDVFFHMLKIDNGMFWFPILLAREQ